MRCPKCGYTSFPYLDRCRKCGQALAEARAVYGAYALPPTPLDLMTAYEAGQVDAAATASPEATSTPSIDVSKLDEIAPALAESNDASPSSGQRGEPPDAAAEAHTTFGPDRDPGIDRPPGASDGAPFGAEADFPIPILDVSDLEDLSLDLMEVPEEAHMSPLEQSTSSAVPGEDEQVFDLDESEPASQTLASEAEPSWRVDAGEEEGEDSREYVLDIDDGLELEIDELESEGEEDKDGDDDDGDDAKR